MLVTEFLIGVGGVAIAVWVSVVLNHYASSRAEGASDVGAASWGSVHAIICLAWAFAVLPAFIDLLRRGPQGAADAVSSTTFGSELGTALSTALVLLCFRLIFSHFHEAPKASIWILAAFLAPWVAIELVSAASAGYIAGPQVVLYPVIAVTFWLVSPPLRLARTVGVLAAITAGTSIFLGLVSPLGVVNAGPAALDKSIIGHAPFLLAGPYGSSNHLALTLALGAPCVLLLQSWSARVIGLGLVAVALAWAAGRTSILAAAVGVTAFLVTERSSATSARAIVRVLFVVGVLLAAWTPLREHDPAAFTDRGVIWIRSLAEWRHHVVFGAGPLYYERADLTFFPLTSKILYGHNLVVDSLVRGGVLGLAAVVVWLLALLRRAETLVTISVFPIAFVLTLVFVSWLEVPLTLSNLGHLAYVCWIPAALICFARDSDASDVGEHPHPRITPNPPRPA